jgi:exodeoxyribonuclease III
MKLTTWNVNSLKVRLPQVLQWLETNPVDVLCIQETKLTDDKFPQAEIEAAGYHVAYTGQKTYNGVAILSRHPMSDIQKTILSLKMSSKESLQQRYKACELSAPMCRMVRRWIRINFSTNCNGWLH